MKEDAVKEIVIVAVKSDISVQSREDCDQSRSLSVKMRLRLSKLIPMPVKKEIVPAAQEACVLKTERCRLRGDQIKIDNGRNLTRTEMRSGRKQCCLVAVRSRGMRIRRRRVGLSPK